MNPLFRLFSILGLYGMAASVHSHWTVGAGLGGVLTDSERIQFVPTGQGWPDDRYQSGMHNTLPLLNLSAGYLFSNTTHRPLWSLEAAYQLMFPTKITGRIQQYALPQFENYDFQYWVRQQTLLGVVKGYLFDYHHVQPFVSLGLGVAFIHASSYTEHAINSTDIPRVSPGYGAHTRATFAYSVGTGVNYPLTPQWWLGLKYDYMPVGGIQTGNGTLGYADTYLKTRLTDNVIALTCHYVFDSSTTSKESA